MEAYWWKLSYPTYCSRISAQCHWMTHMWSIGNSGEGWSVQPQICVMSTITTEFISEFWAWTCQGLLLNSLSAFLKSFAYMPLYTQHITNGVAIAVTGSANLLLKCSNVSLIMYNTRKRNIIILNKRSLLNFSMYSIRL